MNLHVSTCVVNLAAIFLVSTGSATQLSAPPAGEHGPPIKHAMKPAKLSYEKMDADQLVRLQGVMTKSAVDEGKTFAVKTSYARLFADSEDGYQGFGLLTGRVTTGNRISLNSSLGRFLPDLDGELIVTYRFLGAEVASSLDDWGSLKERGMENSIAASFNRYLSGPFKQAAVWYRFIHLPGQESGNGIFSRLSPNAVHK